MLKIAFDVCFHRIHDMLLSYESNRSLKLEKYGQQREVANMNDQDTHGHPATHPEVHYDHSEQNPIRLATKLGKED